jgi:hypothetical protein
MADSFLTGVVLKRRVVPEVIRRGGLLIRAVPKVVP